MENVRIDSIIAKIGISNSEKEKEYIIREKIRNFLKNAHSSEEEEYLYDIIDSISWYKRIEVQDFFINEIKNKYTDNDIFLRFVKENKQKRLESSSDLILAALVDQHLIDHRDVVPISYIKDKNLECNNLFILDDFIGSGSTIFNNVLKILDRDKLKINNLYIICYSILSDGKTLLEKILKEKFHDINHHIISMINEEKYNNKIKNDLSLNFINDKCSTCKLTGYEFGYKSSATCLAINMTSPNTNISILWSNDFDDWIRLLDRDLDLIALENRNLRILKSKKNELISYYNLKVNNNLLTLKEFKILILIYNCSKINKNLLDEFEICNTIEERNFIISNLIEKGILKSGQYYLEIINKEVLLYCEKFEKSLIDKHIREKTNRFF